MRIGVDAREIQNGVVTGIGRSLDNFIKYFSEHDKENLLVLFSEKSIPVSYAGGIDNVVVKKKVHTFIWDQLVLPWALKKNKIDLFYSPYYKAPLMTRVPYVNQVLDLMYLVFPVYKKNLGFWKKLYHFAVARMYSKKAISIITDSLHAKSDIIRLWNINAKKISVIPLGVAKRFKPVTDISLLSTVKQKYSLTEKYILYLGNFKPHKNVKSLVYAFKMISGEFKEHKLILAGPLDEHGQEMKKTVEREGLTEKVVFTDTIRAQDHPEVLLTLADIFVFPTLYEGFGLPPLEAMACGTPVITSNLTAVPEVIGNSGVMIEPTNIDKLGNTIKNLLSDPEKREDLRAKGLDRVKKFTEVKTAGKIYEHITTLLEGIR